MSDEFVAGSILAVDFGSVNTRAVLVDVVEGMYRLVSRAETRSTDIFPVHDMAVAFDRVLREISDATGRRFLSEDGHLIKPEQADRTGVDSFALTASIGRPLRAVVVGLMPGMSIASALRATAGTYIEVADTIGLDDGRDEEARLNAILLSYPDVIFITGGTEKGAKNTVLRLAETVRLAISLLDAEHRPSVLYSGNHALIDDIRAMFEDLTPLLFAENVRPSLEEERFEAARLQLGRAFDRHKESRDESFALIGAMSNTGILPTAQSYTVLAGYLGQSHFGDVALVDVGSSSSTLAISRNHGQSIINSIRTDIGLGHSAQQTLAAIGIDKLRQWLPFNISESDLNNYALNKTLRPATVPMSLRDVYIEHALLRAGVREMLTRSNPEWENNPLYLSQVIGAGAGLTHTGDPGYDALLLIDAIQPAGVTFLHNDPHGLVAAMGAMAVDTPNAVIHLMEDNNLNPLGTCVSAEGKLRRDKPAMEVKVTTDYNGQKEVTTDTVLGGHLMVYSLPLGKTAKVEIKCKGGAQVQGKRKLKLTLTGGLVGLIFDARGRPLPLMTSVETRAEQFPLWVHEMTDDPILEMDEAWLEPLEEEETPKERGKKDKKRRGKKDRQADDAEANALDEMPDLDDLDDLLMDGLDDDEGGLDDLLS